MHCVIFQQSCSLSNHSICIILSSYQPFTSYYDVIYILSPTASFSQLDTLSINRQQTTQYGNLNPYWAVVTLTEPQWLNIKPFFYARKQWVILILAAFKTAIALLYHRYNGKRVQSYISVIAQKYWQKNNIITMVCWWFQAFLLSREVLINQKSVLRV